MGTDAMQRAVADVFQDWLVAHPLIGWEITHPLWSIGLGLLLLFLFWGLLNAIGRLTERLWVTLLRMPLQLGQWVGQRLFRFIKLPSKVLSSKVLTIAPEPISPGKHKTLQDTLLQIEQLQLEQIRLLQEIRQALTKENVI
jgi:hypothetical protein